MIPIFYRPEMVAHAESYSPSAAKPNIVIDHWLAKGRIQPEQLRSFEPADIEDFTLAHDEHFVRAVLSLEEDNGFGNRSQAVADSLPYTTGSMIAAMQHVLEHGGFACSPTSGFHHAGRNYASGFCTFNGLAVAAIMGAMQGAKVGILDCDAHYGDGTDNILGTVKNLGIKHHTFGKHYPCGTRAKGWKNWLLRAIDDLHQCDVILYQAGAGPYIADPLGGQLDMAELAFRDELVFGMLDNVAWNFAGGYTRDASGDIPEVVAIHTRTLSAANRNIEAPE